MEKVGANPLKQVFGSNMRRQRLNLNISQEELSFRAGLHRNYISDVERGTRNVSIISMEKIANGLGVDVYELLKENTTNL